MIVQQYENLKTTDSPRKELIAIKQELKDEVVVLEWQKMLQGNYDIFLKFLEHEDAKVRKNAALILGKLQAQEAALPLYEAYQKETQRFVKSDYLTALAQLDYKEFIPELEKRLADLEAYQPAENEEKHVREEMTALRKMVSVKKSRKHLVFQGYQEEYEVILTTGKVHQEVTSRQIRNGKILCMKSGVRVKTNDIRELLEIPTYREMLFLLSIRTLQPKPEQGAEALAQSNLLELLRRAHKTEEKCRFRLGIHSRMSLEKRGEFAKKLAFALEKATSYQLENSTSDYEIEIRLMEKSDGTFLPLIKFFTFPDKRFQYRKNTIAASIRPEQAAVIAALAKPYMEQDAQIIDPFCGVGTMLLERNRVCPARVMYGVDIFGKAILGARENTEIAGQTAYYINRNFFEFTHEYLFDEIITNMPERGQKSKEEQDAFYGKFFEKATEILREKGRIIMYSNEKNFVKKQLRIQKNFTMLQEYNMDEKDRYYLFIIEKRNNE